METGNFLKNNVSHLATASPAHKSFKGTQTRLVKFVHNFFLPQILYISRMKSSLNKTTIFKLMVHGIELRAAFEERENKQKNAKLQLKKQSYLSFPIKLHLVMQFYGKRQITLNYSMFINIKGSCHCLQIKNFYG